MTEPVAWEADIESALVERLRLALDPLPVDPLPEEEWQFIHPVGHALVMWTGGDCDPSVVLHSQAQPADLGYEVLLYARSLRDGKGLYPMWAKVRQALLGWEPLPGLQPLRLARVRPQGHDDGAWVLSCTWSTEVMYIAATEEETGPPVSNIEFTEDCGCDDEEVSV